MALPEPYLCVRVCEEYEGIPPRLCPQRASSLVTQMNRADLDKALKGCFM